MISVTANVKRGTHRVIAHAVARLLRAGAVYDPVNFRIWEQRGYHVTPIHFYYPIPDTSELRRRYPTGMAGAGYDLQWDAQREFLRQVIAPYADECADLYRRPPDDQRFYLDNDAFSGIDPYVYYAMIRHLKPESVLEVGSGFSTMLAAEAVERNGTGTVKCIDPWPRAFIKNGSIPRIPQRVEDVDPAVFQTLQAGDILFVDSSHVVRTGGDVCHIVLNVLPVLQPGVIVHFHDIYLPFEYPPDLVLDRLQFWTEQYLLQAYITENPSVSVLFACHAMLREHPNDMREYLPLATPFGASFWIQKMETDASSAGKSS
ncbi:MAG TPA: class I SAM-dependent methyltransferase [Thermomicrobiales bacterium]|nr:class I SAM-dependent methyltransferase [Thermomicrobiales bacterium]